MHIDGRSALKITVFCFSSPGSQKSPKSLPKQGILLKNPQNEKHCCAVCLTCMLVAHACRALGTLRCVLDMHWDKLNQLDLDLGMLPGLLHLTALPYPREGGGNQQGVPMQAVISFAPHTAPRPLPGVGRAGVGAYAAQLRAALCSVAAAVTSASAVAPRLPPGLPRPEPVLVSLPALLLLASELRQPELLLLVN